MVKNLILSRRTRLEFVNAADDARLKLAAEELEGLVKRRFASKNAPDQEVKVCAESSGKCSCFYCSHDVGDPLRRL